MHIKIGELAKRAGLTVRTLHHYDRIGLLSPSFRSENGFRLYDQDDVIRLQRIQALKSFGCSLSEIKEFLARPTDSLPDIISRQISVLEQQIQKAQRLHLRLSRLKERLIEGAATELPDWLTILEVMAIYERRFSRQELEMLHAGKSSDSPEPHAVSPPKPTALRVAQLRAVHQIMDKPLIFADPFACKILGDFPKGDLLPFDTPLYRGLRTSIVLRSRVADDQWRKSFRLGLRQYVILGAGLDTAAFRHGQLKGVKIFEVDLPSTQTWKRECMRLAGMELPASLTFVPMDFETSSLAAGLDLAGFNADHPAFFSWLGVTMYIDETSILDTLRYIASCAPKSTVIFDYCVDPSHLSPRDLKGFGLISSNAEKQGEPWKTFFDPDSLVKIIFSCGFREVRDLGPEELTRRYLAGRRDSLRKSGTTRLIQAEV